MTTKQQDLERAALQGYRFLFDDLQKRIAELERGLGETKPAAPAALVSHVGGRRRRRRISAEGLKRIADATRKRWAKYRATKAREARAGKKAA